MPQAANPARQPIDPERAAGERRQSSEGRIKHSQYETVEADFAVVAGGGDVAAECDLIGEAVGEKDQSEDKLLRVLQARDLDAARVLEAVEDGPIPRQ